MILVSAITSFSCSFFFAQALTRLDLQNNSIGDQGAGYLAAALLENTVREYHFLHLFHFHSYFFIQILSKLNLSTNQIGDQGALYLAYALLDNTVCQYRSLYLFHFHF